ncbi:MAG: hypothetical protein RLZZ69_329, partial [Cyanobacteriota bacterium]
GFLLALRLQLLVRGHAALPGQGPRPVALWRADLAVCHPQKVPGLQVQDVLKTGLTVVEIVPGIGAVIGASTNAAILYVLGQTACRFYQAKVSHSESEIVSMQTKTDTDWQVALKQSEIMDRILAHMVQVSYPDRTWAEILPQVKTISPSSVETIAVNLEQRHDLSALLKELIPEFASLTWKRCYEIAISQGNITPEEQEVLSQIAIKFNLDLSALSNQ